MSINELRAILATDTAIIVTGIDSEASVTMTNRLYGAGFGDTKILVNGVIPTGVNEVTVCTLIPDDILRAWVKYDEKE